MSILPFLPSDYLLDGLTPREGLHEANPAKTSPTRLGKSKKVEGGRGDEGAY